MDEEGSEAAALTGIILDIRTARVPQVVNVDRQVIRNASFECAVFISS